MVQQAGAKLDAAEARGLNQSQAWNAAGDALFKASRVHCVFSIAYNFVNAVKQVRGAHCSRLCVCIPTEWCWVLGVQLQAAASESKDEEQRSFNLASTLRTVCNLFILHYLSEVWLVMLRCQGCMPNCFSCCAIEHDSAPSERLLERRTGQDHHRAGTSVWWCVFVDRGRVIHLCECAVVCLVSGLCCGG